MALSPGSAAEGEQSLQNIIIIYIDDIGTDLLGIYDSVNPYGTAIQAGAPDPWAAGIYVQTPHLDALAGEGVTFMNAYATFVCSPGRGALLTGCYSRHTGLGGVVGDLSSGDPPTDPPTLGFHSSRPLAEFGDAGYDLPTLAEMATKVGVTSGIFGKWHLGLLNDIGPPGNANWDGILSRGHWDEYSCVFGNLDKYPRHMGGAFPKDGYNNFVWKTHSDASAFEVSNTYATMYTFDEVEKFCILEKQPFLAYVAPNAGHSPFYPESRPTSDRVTTQTYLAIVDPPPGGHVPLQCHS